MKPGSTRPLEGLTVVVTGSRRASEQAALVTNLGGKPYVVPTVGISLPADDSEILPFLRKLVAGVDYAVFMTATGVRAMMNAAGRAGLQDSVRDALNSPKTTVVARSGKPRGELSKWAVKVDATPPLAEATAEGIRKVLQARALRGKTVALLWHGARQEGFREELIGDGAREVNECLTYRYSRDLEKDGADVLRSIGFRHAAPEERAILTLIEELIGEKLTIDAITFTSPPAVSNLFEIAGEHGLEQRLSEALSSGRTIVVAVGPTTRSTLEDEFGVRVHVMPKVPGMGAMMNALAENVRSRKKEVLSGPR